VAGEESPNAWVLERREVHEGLVRLRVRAERLGAAFEPGQFTNLGLEVFDRREGAVRFVRRAYTPLPLELDSRRADDGGLEFYVRRVESGRLSPALCALAAGARLWLDPAVYGRLTLAGIPPERDVVFVGTGTGIAPFVAMARAYAGRRCWRRAVLVESVREARDLGFATELAALAERERDFVWLPTLTRERADSGWTGSRGRIQALLDPAAFAERTGVALSPANAHVLLCGNPAMLADVEAVLGALGFKPDSRRSPGEVRSERYW
jgi:ferredoxin--NADP+ reductase